MSAAESKRITLTFAQPGAARSSKTRRWLKCSVAGGSKARSYSAARLTASM